MLPCQLVLDMSDVGRGMLFVAVGNAILLNKGLAEFEAMLLATAQTSIIYTEVDQLLLGFSKLANQGS